MTDNRISTEVSETKNYSTLKIKFDCGLNDDGKTIVKSRSYSSVKANAKALDVFNVAETLISLQQHDKLSIVKQDNTELN